MTSVADIMREHRDLLDKSPTSRLDTEVLLAHCLAVDRSVLFREPERQLTSEQLARVSELLNLRQAGRPVSQLTGHAEFYGVTLAVNEHVLIPRADTETLVEEALSRIGRRALSVIDLGTGSGAIAIAIAKNCAACDVTAIDSSPAALAVAEANVNRHGLKNVRVLKGDWLDLFQGEAVDMILSNPPYVASNDPHFETGGIAFEPRLALDGGADGLDAYRKLIPQAHQHLRAGGELILEHGHDQAAAIGELLQNHGFQCLGTRRDLAGHERISFGQK